MTTTSERPAGWRPGLAAALSRRLADRRLPIALAVLAGLTMAPALWHGWMRDDWVQRARLLPPTDRNGAACDTGWVHLDSHRLRPALMEQFTFVGPPFDTGRLMDTGVLPWWTDRNLLLSFWRPVAALTHWLDFQLWPRSAALMHAHNIFWFAAAVYVVALLYRRLLGAGWPAGLAALLYTLDANHYFPVAWIANRNALIGFVFGVLALLSHDRWRQRGDRTAAIGAALAICAALLSAEAGVATLAYLAAYALCIERGARLKRAASLAPGLAVTGIWLVVYHALGYGAHNSGLYVDPVRSPARFLVGVLARGPILLLGQLGWPPPEVCSFLSDSALRLAWGMAFGCLALLLVIMWPKVRGDRTARFCLLGLLLSTVPACALSVPSGRPLVFGAIGAMGLIARFAAGVLTDGVLSGRRRVAHLSAWGLCVLLLGLHLGLAAAARPGAPLVVASAMRTQARWIDVGLSPPSADRVVVVNAPSPFLFVHAHFVEAEPNHHRPPVTRILAPAFAALTVTRPDEHTLVLRAHSGSLFAVAERQSGAVHAVHREQRFDAAFRESRAALGVGARVALTGLTIEVLDAGEDGRPCAVSYCFDVPLDHSSLRWLMWDWRTQAYAPFHVPPLGETVEIAGPS